MLTSMKLTGQAVQLAEYHARAENYYYDQSTGVDDVLEGDGGNGLQHVHIHGKLCGKLGLVGGQNITEKQFTNILSGCNARGEKITKTHKTHGIDLTFSAPKTVSIAGLLTERDPNITKAHDEAVRETMAEIEKYCGGAHPSAKEHVITGNMAYAMVRDGFSREHDPHLHTHVVVMNMTEYQGKVWALDGKNIMSQDFNKMWGAFYRNRLAAQLREYGYGISYEQKGEWRLDCVSVEVEHEFSTRRRQIKEQKEAGMTDMDAWRKTRQDKKPESFKEGILASWRKRLEAFTTRQPSENRRLAAEARSEWFKKARFSLEAKQELRGDRKCGDIGRWQLAARRASERSGCPSRQAIITDYLTEVARSETWTTLTYEEAERRLDEQVKQGYFVALNEDRIATWELMRADREYMGKAKIKTNLALSQKETEQMVAAWQSSAKAQNKRTMSAQQEAAAKGILSNNDSVVLVQGDAGAGKTTMLKAVHDMALAKGFAVEGVAAQGVAARKLEEESGIKSTTLTSYLARERAPEDGPRMVIIDEASMLDSRGTAELIQKAVSRGDKIVMVGDRNQLQSVGAGRPFERLVEDAERRQTLLELTENWRQRDAVLREAVDFAKKGQMRDSLELLDKTGRVFENDDTKDRRKDVAALYDKNTLILTGTVAGRDALNELIRGKLLETGEIQKEKQVAYTFARMDEDGIDRPIERSIAPGEKITFLMNEYKDLDVRNGERGTVLEVKPGGLVVKVEDGRTVEVDVAKYKHIDHGYALTTYKSQGQTFDKVVVEADTRTPSLNDMRNQYVNITRCRDDVKIFTDDKESLAELAGVGSVKRDTLDQNISLEEVKKKEDWIRQKTVEEVLDQARNADEKTKAEAREASAAAARAAATEEHTEPPVELEAAPGPQERSAEPVPPEQKKEAYHIENEEVLRRAKILHTDKDIIERGQKIEARLTEREDIGPDRKRRIADFFKSDESQKVWESRALSPDGRIAAAAALIKDEKAAELAAVLPKIEKDIINTIERTKTRERGRGRE